MNSKPLVLSHLIIFVIAQHHDKMQVVERAKREREVEGGREGEESRKGIKYNIVFFEFQHLFFLFELDRINKKKNGVEMRGFFCSGVLLSRHGILAKVG